MYRSPSATAQPARRAFTLVEILVVVVILGIVSAVVLPMVGSRDDLRGAAAARIAIADLIYAQNLAISMQRTHYVRFSGNGYGIYTVPTGGSPILHPINKTPYVATFGPGGTAGLDPATLDAVSFDGQTTLAFDDLGTPYSYNAVTAALTPLAASGRLTVVCGTHRLRIDVEPFTGEMSVTQE